MVGDNWHCRCGKARTFEMVWALVWYHKSKDNWVGLPDSACRGDFVTGVESRGRKDFRRMCQA